MKIKPKSALLNACSVILLIAAAFTVSACMALGAKPYREKGSAPQTEQNRSTSVSMEETAWDGSFGTFLVCGIDNTNTLTDVILLVSFDNSSGRISLLQIPRDTYAGRDIPTRKYNAVYNHREKGVSGMENLKAHVENDFGVKIDNYAAVTTTGLRRLVDAAGGVELNVPIEMNYDDPGQNLHIHLKKGMQTLNGAQAEEFVRFRKGWSEGDMGRLKAQRLFLAAFAEKLRGMSAARLSSKVLPALTAPDFKTDLTTLEMIRLGLAAKKISLSKAEIYTMPGEYMRVKGLSVYSVDKKKLLGILNSAFIRPGANRLTLGDLHITELTGGENEPYGGNSENMEGLLPGQLK